MALKTQNITGQNKPHATLETQNITGQSKPHATLETQNITGQSKPHPKFTVLLLTVATGVPWYRTSVLRPGNVQSALLSQILEFRVVRQNRSD